MIICSKRRLASSVVEKHTEELFRKILLNLKPPEQITVSEWADKYRRLPTESSSESGMWKTSRTPYLRKIMDSISDPTVRKVSIMSSAQIGKSELIINTIGYYAHIDPTSILLVQPTVDAGKGFSKKRIGPSIRDTPALKKVFIEKESSILEKKFMGGFLSIVGANSPAGLSSQPIQILCCDEVDRYELSAGHEGDPVSLAEKRTTTFQDIDKHIFVSTPTIEGVSRIEHEFRLGTMEEWEIPCPACGEYQVLTWNKIKFTLDEKRKLVDSEDVLCVCEHCGEFNNEYVWKRGMAEGRWKESQLNKEIKSFHLSSLVSPWKTWDKIVKDFLSSKNDREKLKVWTNTELGETFALLGDGVDTMKLYERREKYGCDLPEGVLILTAAVDVQDDRFEVDITGWGRNYESWAIKYTKIYGELTKSEVWDRLDFYLNQTFKFKNGNELSIANVCLDTGGHFTTEAYKFCKRAKKYRLRGIKGMGGNGIQFLHKTTIIKEHKIRIQILGVNSGKETVMGRLKTEDIGESYCHFPSEPEKGYDLAYFEGLTAEHQIIKMVSGRPQALWELKRSGLRNEPFDLRNYNTAALEMLMPINFDALEDKINKGINHSKRKEKK